MTARTYKELLKQGLDALATHSGVILDATFSSRTSRELLRDQCDKAGVDLRMVELNASNEEIKSRLRARSPSAIEISDARLEDFAKLTAASDRPLEHAPDLIRLSAVNAVSETAKAVLQQLAERQLQQGGFARPRS